MDTSTWSVLNRDELESCESGEQWGPTKSRRNTGQPWKDELQFKGRVLPVLTKFWMSFKKGLLGRVNKLIQNRNSNEHGHSYRALQQ